jgi:tetratricopeptide (TPR) repeat protein
LKQIENAQCDNLLKKHNTQIMLKSIFTISLFLIGISLAAQNPDSLIKEAQEKYKKKDYKGAFVSYQSALKVLGNKATPNDYYGAGLSAYFAKDYSNAEIYLTKLTEVSPDFMQGWYYLAKTKAHSDPDIEANPELLEEFGKAVPAFEKYLKLASAEKDTQKRELSEHERINALQYLCYYWVSNGDIVKGCELLNSILSIEPNLHHIREYMKKIGCP